MTAGRGHDLHAGRADVAVRWTSPGSRRRDPFPEGCARGAL